MGAKLWYLSCPAVSQISNFTVASFTANVWEKNAAPIVDSCFTIDQINSAKQCPQVYMFKELAINKRSRNRKPLMHPHYYIQNNHSCKHLFLVSSGTLDDFFCLNPLVPSGKAPW